MDKTGERSDSPHGALRAAALRSAVRKETRTAVPQEPQPVPVSGVTVTSRAGRRDVDKAPA